jgi:hypothetical protein
LGASPESPAARMLARRTSAMRRRGMGDPGEAGC